MGNNAQTKSLVNDAVTLQQETNSKGVNADHILNKTETQQASMNQMAEDDKLVDKQQMTPISLSHAKQTMLQDNGQGTEFLSVKHGANGETSANNREFPTDYEFQTMGGSMHNIQTNDKGQAVVTNANEILSSQKEMETDSQAECVSPMNLMAHQLTPKIPLPPKVNVIKSNTQIVS